MRHVTVRRWVQAGPAEVFKRLGDVEAMAAHTPGLVLLEAWEGKRVPCRGDTFVFEVDHGARPVRLRVEVAEANAPHHLAAAIGTRGTHWLATAEVVPLDDGISDLCLRAEPEAPSTPARLARVPLRLVRGRRVVRHRAQEAVEALLEAMADHVEHRSHARSSRSTHRIAPGR